jgi:hypothetical protein
MLTRQQSYTSSGFYPPGTWKVDLVENMLIRCDSQGNEEGWTRLVHLDEYQYWIDWDKTTAPAQVPTPQPSVSAGARESEEKSSKPKPDELGRVENKVFINALGWTFEQFNWILSQYSKLSFSDFLIGSYPHNNSRHTWIGSGDVDNKAVLVEAGSIPTGLEIVISTPLVIQKPVTPEIFNDLVSYLEIKLSPGTSPTQFPKPEQPAEVGEPEVGEIQEVETSYPSLERKQVELDFVHKVMRETVESGCLAKEAAHKYFFEYFGYEANDETEAYDKFKYLRGRKYKGRIDNELEEKYLNKKR